MIRSLTRGSILGVLLLLMSAVPAVAADMSDTDWDLEGRSRTWVRSVGRDFGGAVGTMYFDAPGDADEDGTVDETAPWLIALDEPPMDLTGFWYDDGGRRFRGEVDEEAFMRTMQAFLSQMYDVPVDAVEVDVVRNRIWGKVNRDGDRMRMKVRFKGDIQIETPEGIIARRGWIKMRLRGELISGTPEP